MDDPGESLVGSYLHYIVGCQLVLHNTVTPGEQGELDVIGVQLTDATRTVWFCEVTTHIQGFNYGEFESTVRKVRDKIRRARVFADATFPDHVHHYEIWSPVVRVGRLTEAFDRLESEFSEDDLNVKFVINERYSQRVRELVEHARKNTSATSEPAYRLLQILTRLRGEWRV
jgi:Holliday junction resolvase-like predicted endonuclease